MGSDRRERGQAVPLVCLLLVVAGGLTLGLGRLGEQAASRARARTAADAAALAGAAEGEAAARALARANGGRLLSFAQDGPDVEVRVAVGGARAVARARKVAAAVGAPARRWPGPSG